MGKPPVAKGQAETGNGVRDLLAATQLLYVCHLWVEQTIRKVWSLVYPGIPFAASKFCVGNNLHSAWSSSALFLGGGVVTSRSRMN